MGFADWRYEPLDPKSFRVGDGPFRVSGRAFAAATSYLDRRLPGGHDGLLAALGPKDPFLAYYAQRFEPERDYDASALLYLLRVAAKLAHAPLARFIEARSRWSAKRDAPKEAKAASPESIAMRMPTSFNGYFWPPYARAISVSDGVFEGELAKVPVTMDGLYVAATVGFVSGSLELAGAKGLHFEWERPAPGSSHGGTRCERLRFVATWRR